MQNSFQNGLTIRELKNLLAGWPDEDEDGEATHVYITTGKNLSSQVCFVWPLNARTGTGGKLWSDILLSPSE